MTRDELREALLAAPVSRRLAVFFALKATLRQGEIADRAGLTDTELSRIVTGRRRPTDDQRKAIAKALGIAVADLFGEAA